MPVRNQVPCADGTFCVYSGAGLDLLVKGFYLSGVWIPLWRVGSPRSCFIPRLLLLLLLFKNPWCLVDMSWNRSALEVFTVEGAGGGCAPARFHLRLLFKRGRSLLSCSAIPLTVQC